MSNTNTFLTNVMCEHERATHAYPAFHSYHEGYAVILEEVDELWDEVRKKDGQRRKEDAYNECVQIAAMVMRFATELCGTKIDPRGGNA